MANYIKYQAHGSNFWRVRWREIDQSKGFETYRSKSGFQTKHKAQEWYYQYASDNASIITHGSDQLTAAKLTVEKLYRDWMDAKTGTVRPSTLLTIKTNIEAHLLEEFGDELVNNFPTQKYERYLLASSSANSTLKERLRVHKSLFDYAQKKYQIANPIADIKIRSDHGVGTDYIVWDADDFSYFIDFVEDDIYKIAFSLLFYCGLRLGEMTALQYGDIDARRKTASINKQLTNLGTVTSTKTSSSRRIVPVPDGLITMIRDYQRAHKKKASDTICTYWREAYRYEFDKRCDIAGCQRIRLHDLRHSYASMLISHNLPVTAVSRLLGHSSVETTMRVYSHMLNKDFDKAAGMINSIFETRKPME